MNAGKHAKPGCMGLVLGVALLVILALTPLLLVACKRVSPTPNPTATTIDLSDVVNAEICSQVRYAIAHNQLNDPQIGVQLLALADKRAADQKLSQAVAKYYAALDAKRDATTITTQCDRLGR